MGWAASEAQRAEWRDELTRAATGDVDFLVAEIDGEVVGKLVIDWVHNEDGTPWLWLGSVDPRYRNAGIGSRGLAMAEARVGERGHTHVEMSVDDDNPRARELYLRHGYVVVGPYVDEHDEVDVEGTTRRVLSPGVRLRKTL